jgi:rhamnosyltransferase
MNPTKVYSVIVSYNPDLERFQTLLSRIVQQCSVVVCDNSDAQSKINRIVDLASIYGAHYLGMQGNVGIAVAQNLGARFSFNKGADYVLLLDDDSIPDLNIVEKLYAFLKIFDNDSIVVSAVPIMGGVDVSNTNTRSAVRSNRDLMSSGTMISRRIFDCVGGFQEDLFIDGVDFEWGWRARRNGVQLYVISSSSIQHRLGVSAIPLLSGIIKIPSPVRHYYQYRNILYLIVFGRSPCLWRIKEIFKVIIKIPAIMFMPNPFIRYRFACRGVVDFLLGKSGQMANATRCKR